MKIGAFCEATHAKLTIGSQGDTGVGATVGVQVGASLSTGAAMPCEVVPDLDLVGDIVANRERPTDGAVAPPRTPGIGVEIDEDALHSYGESIEIAGSARVVA